MLHGNAVFLWPLFGFFLLCALLSLREAANPERTIAERGDGVEDEPLPRPNPSSTYAAYRAQQDDPARIARSARRRAILFGLLAAATLAYVLVRR
ncbi:MAG TPA: hypothetical protein VFW35_03055 [Sphingomicrobium sp.]|nr:hypothetical protein [Sphingomicrobium sp.]